VKKFFVLVMTLAFLLSACGTSAPAGAQGGIEISTPFAHAAGTGETTAAYMIIKNTGAEADKLISVSCDAAMMTQAMESKMEGDVMSMGDVPVIDLPAGGTVELKSGGYHIMLMELTKELKAGDTISLVLEFEKAGKMTLNVPVLAIGTTP
jgi:periplasmic copper chaperone A